MVTIFANIKQTETPFFRPIEKILERTRDGNSKEIVEKIRKEKDKSLRNIMKQSLPAICFSGTFNKRLDTALVEHSGFICLDFDGYATTKEMKTEKDLKIKCGGAISLTSSRFFGFFGTA